MAQDNFQEKQESANDNVLNSFFLKLVRDINQGRFKAYLLLSDILENGYGVREDQEKALKGYEKYYEEYRRLVPSKFNVIEYVIDIGNKYMALGNKYKAAEWYLQASMHIIEEHADEKKRQRIFKKYKLEKLIKETGCHDIV